ncbi:hypothetical protein HAX54_033230, partial [Datura stramonium]|nr:hypothetical protein [Datura stramonium]
LHEKVKEAESSTTSVVSSKDRDDPSSEPRSVSIIFPAIGGGALISPTITTLLSAPAPTGSTIAEIGSILRLQPLWILGFRLQLPLAGPRASRMPQICPYSLEIDLVFICIKGDA